MAMVTFRCEYCSHQVNADEALAGQRARCPNKDCQKVIIVPGLQPAEEPGDLATLPTKLLDALLGVLRFVRGRAGPFWKYQRVMAAIGVYAILAAGGLIALQLMVAAIRTNQMTIFGMALAALVAAVLLHYLSAKFAMACEMLLRSNPETLGHKGIPDCVGFCAVGGAIFYLLFGIWLEIQTRSGGAFLVPFFVVFLLLTHLAILSLNPEDCLNMRRDSEKLRPGPMALAIVNYFFRCALALVPVSVAVLAGLGAIWALIDLMRSFGSDYYGFMPQIESPASAGGFVLLAGIIPLLAYLLYVLEMLYVDLCQAILTLFNRSVPVARAEAPPPAPKAAPSAPAAPPANVFCSACGAKNHPGAKFCEGCGKAL